jgi:phenylalanyl-tRNA synthetase alpha chain
MRFSSVGRVYRSDCDATDTLMLNQIEGIMIDKNIGFAHLNGYLRIF